MRYIFSFALLFVLNSSFGQHIQWTLKPGASANQVDVYLRPTFAFNPGAATPFEYFGQVQFALAWSTSCPTGPQPTMGFTIDPSFSTQGGGFYNTTVFARSNSINPAGETYYVVYLERVGSGAQSYAANTEVKVGTATFTGSTPSCSIKIVDYEDGGSDGQANCFATNSRTGEFLRAGPGYAPGVSSDNFYSSPGISTAGGNAISGFAQLNTLVSLPVKLIYFTTTSSDCAAILEWKTADEINFSHFEIEESHDGILFRKIARLDSKGGSDANYYRFVTERYEGKKFYRLRMLDIDGHFSYSPVRVSENSCGSSVNFKVFPNPLVKPAQQLTLSFSTKQNEAGAGNLSIYAAGGQAIYQKIISISAGQNSAKIEIPHLPAGSYFIRLTGSNGKEIGHQSILIK